jgi:hypothetical protein
MTTEGANAGDWQPMLRRIWRPFDPSDANQSLPAVSPVSGFAQVDVLIPLRHRISTSSVNVALPLGSFGGFSMDPYITIPLV